MLNRNISTEALRLELTPELRDRVQQLSRVRGVSVSECLIEAVAQHVDTWETHLRDLDAAPTEEEIRPLLRAVG